jgi:hypothetical protein
MLIFKGGMSQVTSSYHKLLFVCKFFVEHSYLFASLITIYFNRVSPLAIKLSMVYNYHCNKLHELQ